MKADRQTAGRSLRARRLRAGPRRNRAVRQVQFFNPSVQAAVVFQDSIAGLSVGAPVTFRGVRVGAVESIGIEFDPQTNIAYIPVTVRLEPGRALITRKQTDNNVDLPNLINAGPARRTERAKLRHRPIADRSRFRSGIARRSCTRTSPTCRKFPPGSQRCKRQPNNSSQLPLRELARTPPRRC